MVKTFTYAVSNGDQIKIGRAGNVERRLASLQCSSPHRLELVYVFDGDIERKAHVHLEKRGHRRLVGEWFVDTRPLRDDLWGLGFKAVGAYEEDHRQGESQRDFCNGYDSGFQAGIEHWNRAMDVGNDGVEEHW